MAPSVPRIPWRDILPADGNKNQPFVVDGYIIPPRIIISVNTYSIHHNEAYFPDPFSYRLERWLTSSSSTFSEEQKKVMRDAFVSFSIGSRGCAGKAIAYLETNLIHANTLWYFDFTKTKGTLGEIGAGKSGWEIDREGADEFQIFDLF